MTTISMLDNSVQLNLGAAPIVCENSPTLSISRIPEGSCAVPFTSTQAHIINGAEDSASESSSSPRIHALRRSFSDDSFIRAARKMEGHESLLSGSRRDENPEGDKSASEPRTLSSPPSSRSISSFIRSKVGKRRRGASYSTTDNETSTQEDSDFDRSSTATKARVSVRSRLLSLKRKKSASTASDQPVMPVSPSRLPARGTSASLSNLRRSIPSASEIWPVSSSAVECPPLPRAVEPKRKRSHSLGAPMSYPSLIPAATMNASYRHPTFRSDRELAIAVIGANHCGKSTFIRKSLKKYDLSCSESQCILKPANDTTRVINYTSWRAYYVKGDTEVTLTIIECSTQHLVDKKDGRLISIWPSELPRIRGAFVCYDASEASSFSHVLEFLAGYSDLGLPRYVIACKSDLEQQIPGEDVSKRVQNYAKVIETSSDATSLWRLRMRGAVDKLIADILNPTHSQLPRRSSHINLSEAVHTQTNNGTIPTSKSHTPILKLQTELPRKPLDQIAASPIRSVGAPPLQPVLSQIDLPSPISPEQPPSSSQARHRSVNDIAPETQKALRKTKSYESNGEQAKPSDLNNNLPTSTGGSDSVTDTSSAADVSKDTKEATDDHNGNIQKLPNESTFSPWATFEELLDKLFFLTTGGDDPPFIAHFLLTYRRFATPRNVLLGMQKRMNELRQATNGLVLASYAQLQICQVLEKWIKEYPYDFTVPGAQGALSAFIRQCLTNPQTVSHASDLLPFIDSLSTLKDKDSAWAVKTEGFIAESDESDSMYEDDAENEDPEVESPAPVSPKSNQSAPEHPTSPRMTRRERRSSMPLSVIGFMKAPYLGSERQRIEPSNQVSAKELALKLQKTAQSLFNFKSDAVAQEITRQDLEGFLKVEPREWLRYTFCSERRDPLSDPVAKCSAHYNRLYTWAISLILCHDKPKARARQIEKFAEIALTLRSMNNYSGMRAIITAISSSTYPGDETMEIFMARTELYKRFLSSDILLRTAKSHNSYRMALKGSKGPIIPSLEVHTSDLRRANEGNREVNEDDPTKINWYKYNMIGGFILLMTEFQRRCVGPTGYKFTENKSIEQLFDVPLMDEEMQQSRMPPGPPDQDDPYSSFGHPPPLSSTINGHSKEQSVIKRILPW